MSYPRPALCVDCVVFGLDDDGLRVLLVERGLEPFKGTWALPGGFVHVGESLEQAARRELEEETGLSDIFLEQLYSFGSPNRDPREHVVSVAWYALVNIRDHRIVAATDAVSAQWHDVDALPELAFDHAQIVHAAVQHLRRRLEGSAIAFELVPERFTVAELRSVYQALLGEPQDAGNFRRRFRRLEADGVVAATDEQRATNTKPARLYRFVRS